MIWDKILYKAETSFKIKKLFDIKENYIYEINKPHFKTKQIVIICANVDSEDDFNNLT